MWKRLQLPSPEQALPGRPTPLPLSNRHFVLNHPLLPPFPPPMQRALFGMGCFWGAERRFWSLPGVYTTAVGYAGGFTLHPTYDEVCSGLTGHAEVVLVVFDPNVLTYARLLALFWTAHNPTQGMRQGNDVGTQYRSAIYYYDDTQRQLAEASRAHYQQRLSAAGWGAITTEIVPAGEFYYAEEEHQQYLAKHPDGYCGLGGCGVAFDA